MIDEKYWLILKETKFRYPSEELDTFNQAIIGSIEVTNVFIGNDFRKSENTEIESLILKLKNET
ncbi:hypothetical protein [Chryseobacterium caseinilyticum]|uniref:hypothetical protein n=1 Tax=Chryseobacterium caseinilyticum TaxID=2771428 RepID=UPI00177BD524|nr:hypothetical protein [Chryseobacterium caseinilyticum]